MFANADFKWQPLQRANRAPVAGENFHANAKRTRVRTIPQEQELELVIGIAALNTTNNLLFIVLAAMLAAIVVSGAASAAVLRRLQLEVLVPEIAFAGKPIVARIKVENPRRWLPAFSVRVMTELKTRKKKKLGWEWRKTEFVFPKKREWLRLPDYTLRRKAAPEVPPRIFEKPVYFTFVPARSTAEAEVELTFPRRGRYTQDVFYLATRFPFSVSR